ncbi:4-hydroxythreonine-4-phosphate dehydrogenase PdxA [Roseicyclus sp.]|uniref:4-hydroxythreonine-4-phosphate dehydrogenase PdxA n=1 Tax=Roseicyclus sp. TaxID=1914329 RepID=UPI003FA08D85
MARAPIALTLGEPAGIGRELAAMAWTRLEGRVPFFVVGDPGHLAGLGVPVRTIARPADALHDTQAGLPVLPHPFPAPAVPGKPSPENAQAVISAIQRAVDLVMGGEAGALTTGPIHKKALIDGAGFAYPGHTEYLAHLAGVERVVMMLAGPDLKVVPTTIHIALKDVPTQLDRKLLMDTIRITEAALRHDFGIESPRIAVAGLNPHAGEGGAMGREEIELIAPVIEALRAEGLALTGPHSGDTLFHAAARKGYDAAVCMYHDQALIPIKTLAFDEGVNVTLGLPFVRTSPDHGTAFDIAGTGRANPSSLIAALEMAARMAAFRGAARR